MEEWIRELPTQFPSHAKVEQRGETEEGRPLLALTINGEGRVSRKINLMLKQ